MRDVHTQKPQAYRLGYGAYDDGEALHHNPYHPREEAIQWNNWREGWADAELDADEAKKHGG